ncbi:MAG: DUF4131 domain-containing protein [Proteobacteria bacterium]|nr:DUF4131 domain-containing protein [Pseudomonadota bacterium]
MTSRIYSRPVIPVLASMILGLAFGSWLPGYEVCAYFIILICTGLIIYFILQRKTALILPVILFFAFGYLSLQSWIAPKFPSNHIINFLDSQKRKIVGLIDENPIIYKDRLKFILQTKTLGEDKDKNFPVTGKILVTVRGNFPKIAVGDKVSFTGKIELTRISKIQEDLTIKNTWHLKRSGGLHMSRGKILL